MTASADMMGKMRVATAHKANSIIPRTNKVAMHRHTRQVKVAMHRNTGQVTGEDTKSATLIVMQQQHKQTGRVITPAGIIHK